MVLLMHVFFGNEGRPGFAAAVSESFLLGSLTPEKASVGIGAAVKDVLVVLLVGIALPFFLSTAVNIVGMYPGLPTIDVLLPAV